MAELSLADRTLAALDWAVVLDALSRHARTERGARAALRPDFAFELDQVLSRYQAVTEIRDLEAVGERVPVGAVTDIAGLLDRAGRGATLEGEELRAIGHCLQALRHLRTWVEERDRDIPELRRMILPVVVDAELTDLLARSFDAGAAPELSGLSEQEYPELGAMRRKVDSLKSRIQRTLDELIRTDALGDALMDRYVTQRDGRFVIPVRTERRRGLGIVHGRSQSGETAYVEPAAVVELHNELDETVAELHREVSRILGVLSRMVGRFREPLGTALDAAEQLDLACARASLGKELYGVVPKVGDQGVISMTQARHPVLALRGVTVVPNDLGIDGQRPGLVLSGPNTGGKTVALKTLGLAALMVRSGIPVPCAEGSRVDIFVPVVADVGDWQSVEGDLSTFSGHVEILKAVLRVVERQRPGRHALVLLDELGMGTDPAQGAALARAILERLVDAGARVATTTHFTELKALAAVDPRFESGAVAIEAGRPTYQLLLGTAGESHALAIARRLALPADVVDRARGLLSSSQREISDLVEKLEEERAVLTRKVYQAAQREQELAERIAAMERAEHKLDDRREELERRVSERFQARMKAREQELKTLIAALQDNPNLRLAGRGLAKVRDIMEEAQVPSADRPAAPPPAELKVGDVVIVRSLGKKGKVTRLLKGDQVSVRVGIMEMKLDRADLEGTRGQRYGAEPAPKPKPKPKPRSQHPVAEAARFGGVRVDANTCDLRGQRVAEALEMLDLFLADLVAQGFDQGWVLHGHGTGALKQAVRRELRSRKDVKKVRPADAGEGGDAFTVVEVS